MTYQELKDGQEVLALNWTAPRHNNEGVPECSMMVRRFTVIDVLETIRNTAGMTDYLLHQLKTVKDLTNGTMLLEELPGKVSITWRCMSTKFGDWGAPYMQYQALRGYNVQMMSMLLGAYDSYLETTWNPEAELADIPQGTSICPTETERAYGLSPSELVQVMRLLGGIGYEYDKDLLHNIPTALPEWTIFDLKDFVPQEKDEDEDEDGRDQ